MQPAATGDQFGTVSGAVNTNTEVAGRDIHKDERKHDASNRNAQESKNRNEASPNIHIPIIVQASCHLPTSAHLPANARTAVTDDAASQEQLRAFAPEAAESNLGNDVKGLTKQLRQARAELKGSQDETKAKEAEIEEWRNRATKSENRLEEFMKSSDMNMKKQEEGFKKLEEGLRETWEARLEQALDARAISSEVANEREEDRLRYRQQCEELFRQNESLKLRIAELEEELKNSGKVEDSKKGDQAEALQQREKLTQQLETLASKRETLKRQVEDNQKDLNRVTRQLDGANADKEDLESQKITTGKSYEDCQKRIGEHEQKRSELEKDCGDTFAIIEILNKEFEDLDNQLKSLGLLPPLTTPANSPSRSTSSMSPPELTTADSTTQDGNSVDEPREPFDPLTKSASYGGLLAPNDELRKVTTTNSV